VGVDVGIGLDRFSPAEAWCTEPLIGLVVAPLPTVACLGSLLAVALARAAGTECVGVLGEPCGRFTVGRVGTTTFATGPGPAATRDPGPEPSPNDGR
jgi:hypothetical protein